MLCFCNIYETNLHNDLHLLRMVCLEEVVADVVEVVPLRLTE